MSPLAQQRAERVPIGTLQIAPLNAARTSQRAVPTKGRVKMRSQPASLEKA